MRYWFDCEFIERGPEYSITLLSLGMVAEDGRELYVEQDVDAWEIAHPWVREHVLPQLKQPGALVLRRPVIATLVEEFCDPTLYGKPEFWAYYADYDWVVFCQLFGTMMDLPKGWPMYCRDLKQRVDALEVATNSIIRLPEQGKGEHHALADAKWNREAYDFLDRLARTWVDQSFAGILA